jgi:hypothetical protein
MSPSFTFLTLNPIFFQTFSTIRDSGVESCGKSTCLLVFSKILAGAVHVVTTKVFSSHSLLFV